MKLAHLQQKHETLPKLYAVEDNLAICVTDLRPELKNLTDLTRLGLAAIAELQQEINAARKEAWLKLQDLTFAPAVIDPPITLAVGLNYDEHASELKLDNDAGPVLFTLFPNSLGAHEGQVKIRQEISTEIDYEGELGVIIGREARDISEEEALDYVFGYTVINDITARDIQFREPQWSRCKSFDGFTPVGPYVVTADEIPDPQALKITTDVDDLRVQDSTTGFMIRSIASLVSSLSEGITLKPGTLIATGSPGGAGRSRKPPLYLKPGTTVKVSISNLGTLVSHCV